MDGRQITKDVERALQEARRAYKAAGDALRAAEDAAAKVGVDVTDPVPSLTAQRINLVEPDGTPRIVLTAASQLPGIFVRAKEHPHPSRSGLAGLLFVNDEGTEVGGLLFNGARSDSGHESGVHLSFDNFEQDQVIVLQSYDGGPNARHAMLEFIDRPDWSVSDLIEAAGRGEGVELPADQRPVTRMRLATEVDGSVGLALNDADGRPRIVLSVPATGEAAIQIRDESGDLIGSLP
jgi:hypothetical protein